MVEHHWGGIAAFCKPENKVSLGFVEGLSNKIRVIQSRAYGLLDEEYLRLKILTCMYRRCEKAQNHVYEYEEAPENSKLSFDNT